MEIIFHIKQDYCVLLPFNEIFPSYLKYDPRFKRFERAQPHENNNIKVSFLRSDEIIPYTFNNGLENITHTECTKIFISLCIEERFRNIKNKPTIGDNISIIFQSSMNIDGLELTLGELQLIDYFTLFVKNNPVTKSHNTFFRINQLLSYSLLMYVNIRYQLYRPIVDDPSSIINNMTDTANKYDLVIGYTANTHKFFSFARIVEIFTHPSVVISNDGSNFVFAVSTNKTEHYSIPNFIRYNTSEFKHGIGAAPMHPRDLFFSKPISFSEENTDKKITFFDKTDKMPTAFSKKICNALALLDCFHHACLLFKSAKIFAPIVYIDYIYPHNIEYMNEIIYLSQIWKCAKILLFDSSKVYVKYNIFYKGWFTEERSSQNKFMVVLSMPNQIRYDYYEKLNEHIRFIESKYETICTTAALKKRMISTAEEAGEEVMFTVGKLFNKILLNLIHTNAIMTIIKELFNSDDDDLVKIGALDTRLCNIYKNFIAQYIQSHNDHTQSTDPNNIMYLSGESDILLINANIPRPSRFSLTIGEFTNKANDFFRSFPVECLFEFDDEKNKSSDFAEISNIIWRKSVRLKFEKILYEVEVNKSLKTFMHELKQVSSGMFIQFIDESLHKPLPNTELSNAPDKKDMYEFFLKLCEENDINKLDLILASKKYLFFYPNTKILMLNEVRGKHRCDCCFM